MYQCTKCYIKYIKHEDISCKCNAPIAASLKATLQGKKENSASFVFIENADAFYLSSVALSKEEAPSIHSVSLYLILFATELYLKSLLLSSYDLGTLKSKWGHELPKLYKEAANLKYITNDNDVLKVLQNNQLKYDEMRYYLGLGDVFGHNETLVTDLQILHKNYATNLRKL